MGISMQKASLAGDFDLLLERWLLKNFLVGDDMGRSICAFRTKHERSFVGEFEEWVNKIPRLL